MRNKHIVIPILISCFIIQFSENVRGSDTGWKSPTPTGSESWCNEWTNPTNVYSSDDNYATAEGEMLDQDYYNFDFNLPSGATPTGMQVKVEGVHYYDADDDNYSDSRILVYIWSASSDHWLREEGAGWWSFVSDPYGVPGVYTSPQSFPARLRAVFNENSSKPNPASPKCLSCHCEARRAAAISWRAKVIYDRKVAGYDAVSEP